MYVQAVSGLNMLIRPVLLGGTALPTLFSWNPELAETLPATSTFTRASTSQVLTTTDGTTDWYQEAKSGELRLDGMRRQENFLGSTAWSLIGTTARADLGDGVSEFSNLQDASFDRARVLVNTGETIGRRYAGYIEAKGVAGETIQFFIKRDGGGGFAGSTITVTLTDDFKKYYIGEYTALSGNTVVSVGIANDGGATADVIQVRTEGACVVDGAPANFVPELLAREQSYNAEVDDVRYYSTTGANTASPSTGGEVTEVLGSTITGGGYLPEPAATNSLTESTDFTAWTAANLTPTSSGVSSLGLEGHSFDAGVAAGAHQIFLTGTVNNSVEASIYCIAEADTGQYLAIRGPRQAAVFPWGVFDLVNGTLGGSNAITSHDIEDLGGGRYKCRIQYNTGSVANSATVIAVQTTSTASTTGDAIAFVGANETISVFHAQMELSSTFSTSPIITSGSTVTRVADSLTDTTWPTEASAVVDTTVAVVIPGGDDANRQNMLGFGAGANRNFQLFASNQAAIINGGISSTITAGTSYAGERHSFGMSLVINEGIVVDDEDNDNTDVSGTPGQGAIHIGSNSSQQTVPARYHQIKIFDQTLTVDDLKGQLP